MRIQVVLALPKRQQVVDLDVPSSCCAREAVQLALRAGLSLADSGLSADTAALGVFGECVSDTTRLQDGDRVEIYRPLQQDPKERRRQRADSERKDGRAKGN